MSRYVERAIAVGRLIDVIWHLDLDAGDHEDEAGFWEPLLGPARDRLSPAGQPTSRDVRYYLAFDPENGSSLACCIRNARAAAQGVRETITSEMWVQLNTVYLTMHHPRAGAHAEDNPHAFYKRVREGMQFVQGLADSTLLRDESWLFFCLGRSLERADTIARMLVLQSDMLTGGASGRDDMVRW